MRILPSLLVAMAAPAAAQWLADPNTDPGRQMAAAFDSQWSRKPARTMPCRFTPFRPFLDYGLRIWAGYGVIVPAAALLEGEPPREVVAVSRVRPLDPPGAPVHFYQRLAVPEPPASADLRRVEMSLGGGWLLGRGSYRVETILAATGGGECRHEWTVKVRESSAMQPPGSVQPLEAALWQGFRDGGRGHAAIFLHATPVRPRRYLSRLSPWDRQVLLSTLSAVLRDGGFQSASLVVFDLMRQEVVLELDRLRPEDMGRLARQLERVDYGIVRYDQLRPSALPGDFLQDLVRRRLRSAPPPDALVFIGARWLGGPKTRLIDPGLREAAPPSFHLAFSLPNVAEQADAVSSLVRGLGGKVFSIYLPKDLAPALREIRQAGR